METYNSGYTAQDLENAIKAVPSIGENGNWYIGDEDTGIYAGGIKVSGAEVGQTIKVTAVDAAGVPTAWEAADFPSGGWEVLDELTLAEDAVPYLDLGATFPNFQKIRVTATIPTMEASTSLTFLFTNIDISVTGGYGSSYQVGTYTGTGNQSHIVEFEPVIVTDREFLFTRSYTIGGTVAYGASYTSYDHARILNVRWFFSKQSFPAGSYIKLEGVRA